MTLQLRESRSASNKNSCKSGSDSHKAIEGCLPTKISRQIGPRFEVGDEVQYLGVNIWPTPCLFLYE